MKITLYPKFLIRRLFVHDRASFFKEGYALLYPEYSRHGMTPWQHYVIDGKRKGFCNGTHPSDDEFFSEGYELEYPDVKAAGVAPWWHYAEKGIKEQRDNGLHPSGLMFFAAGYLEMYPEVSGSDMDPWHHYVLVGRKEGHDNGLHPDKKLFFPAGYIEMYPDVAKSCMDPWHHYVLVGKKEGRDNGWHPSHEQFRSDDYLRRYPDVAKTGIDPWQHYVEYGKKEGRIGMNMNSAFERYTNWIFDLHENKAEFVDNDGSVYIRQENDPKIFAYYLPQFHSIPINDENFGKGFTEWTNVARSTPLFDGHVQPRIPYDLGFYNLENVSVIERQVTLAKQYGIYGFCFYYYWFSGKKVLEKPLKLFLNSKVDFKFHLMWANENWARLWDGGNREVILEQKFDLSMADDFYRDLLPYISDTRYEKINNKPVLAVYKPALFGLEVFKSFVAKLNELAVKDGFDGFYFLGTNYANFSEPEKYSLEGIIEFPPHGMRDLNRVTNVEWFNYKRNVVLYDLHQWVEDQRYFKNRDYSVFKCCFPSWDNSPRKAYTGALIYLMQQNDFYKWLSGIIRWTKKYHSDTEQYVYINAWNEWGEGAFLEPDTRLGYRSLSTVRRALEESRSLG